MITELTHYDYEILVKMLDELIDVVGENENHTLVSLMDLISEFIEIYEDNHVPELTEDIVVL